MIKSILSLLLISVLFTACKPENRDKYTTPEEASKLTAQGEGQVVVHEPNHNVDIIFIIDPSSSMASIIKEVHANIDLFAAEFIDENNVDVHFRIGVVTAWDSKHFAYLKQQDSNKRFHRKANWPNLDFQLIKGELKPVIVNGRVRTDLPSYVSWNMTNDMNELYDTLKNTLKVQAEIHQYEYLPNSDGQLRNVYQLHQFTSDESLKKQGREFVKYTPYSTNNTPEKERILYGPSPNNEEFFTVIEHMLKEETIAKNNGFPSNKANQLAVFVITDSEDDLHNVHNISAEQMHTKLVKFMNNDPEKVVVHGALYESDRDECFVRALDQNGHFILEPEYINGHKGIDGDKNPKYVDGEDTYKMVRKNRDPGIKVNGERKNKPTKIEELINLSGGQINSICSDDFGSDLASVGLSIRERTLEQKQVSIRINTAYDSDTLKVYYGSPNDEVEVNFNFSPESYTQIIIPKDAYVYEQGKKFRVEFDGLTDSNRF